MKLNYYFVCPIYKLALTLKMTHRTNRLPTMVMIAPPNIYSDDIIMIMSRLTPYTITTSLTRWRYRSCSVMNRTPDKWYNGYIVNTHKYTSYIRTFDPLNAITLNVGHIRHWNDTLTCFMAYHLCTTTMFCVLCTHLCMFEIAHRDGDSFSFCKRKSLGLSNC